MRTARIFGSGRTIVGVLGCVLGGLVPSRDAAAQSGTWLNTGTMSSLWSETTNWVGGTVPGVTSGTTVTGTTVFNSAVGTYGTSGSPITIDAGRTLRVLEFQSNSGGYTIGTLAGGTLAFANGGSIVSGNTATNAPLTINAPLQMIGSGSSLDLVQNATGTFTLGGPIIGTAATSGTQTLTLRGNSGSVNNFVAGNITNGTSAGVVRLSTSGSTSWTLSGTSNLGGNMTIASAAGYSITNTGSIAFGSSAGSNVLISSGIFDNKGRMTRTAGTGTFEISGVNAVLVNSGTMNTSMSFQLRGSGSASNSGSMTTDTFGVGTAAGSAGVTPTFVNSGTLAINPVGGITPAIGRETYGTFINNAGGSVTISGYGLFLGTQSTATYSGTTAITMNGGSFTTGGALQMRVNANASNQVAELNLNSGTFSIGGQGRITTSFGGTGTNKQLNVNFNGGTLQSTGDGTTGDFLPSTLTAVTLGANGGTINLTASATNTASAIMSGSGGLTKAGVGTLALTAANTYTGTTSINAGVLQIGSSGTVGALASTSVITGSSGATLAFNRTDDYGGSFVNTISGGLGLQLNSGTLALAGSNTYTGTTSINAGVLQIGTSGTVGSLASTSAITGSSGASLAFNRTDNYGGNFSNTISGGLGLQLNSGTLTLTSNNTYNGTTAINAGILQIGSSGTVGSLANTSAITGSSGASLAFNRTDNYGGNFSNTISGGLGLQLNSGTLTLTSNNTYTGTTAINAGTLNVGSATALGSGGSISFGGGSLQYSAANTADYSARIKSSTGGAVSIDTNGQNVTFAGAVDDTNTAGLTKLGTGTLALTGNNTYTGTTAINAGTLNVGSADALAGGGVISFGGGTLQYSAANTTDYSSRFSTAASQARRIDTNGQNVTFASALAGASGSLTKSGAGTLTLSGSGSTLASGITLNAGQITNSGSMNLATSTVLVTSGSFVNDGRLTWGGGGSIQVNGSDAAFINAATVSAASAAITLRGFGSITNTGTMAGSTLNVGASGGSGDVNSATAVTFTNAAGASATINAGAGFSGVVGREYYGAITNAGYLRLVGVQIGRGFAQGTAVTLAGTSSVTITSGTIDSSGGSLRLRAENANTSNVTAEINLNGGLWTTDTPAISVSTSGNTTGTNNRFFVNFNSGTFRTTNSTGATIMPSTLTAVTLNAGGGTLDIGTLSSGSHTIAATIIGTGGLTKAGAGALRLEAANTYSGTTTVSAGQFVLAHQLAAQNSVLNVASGTLIFDSSASQNAFTIPGLVGGGVATLQSSTAGSSLTFGGDNSTTSFPGLLNVVDGTVFKIGSGAATLGSLGLSGTAGTGARLDSSGASPLVVSGSVTAAAGNKTLTLAGSNAGSNSIGAILDPSSGGVTQLVKSGPGRWVLSGSSNYSGPTTIEQGELLVAASASGGGNGSLGANTSSVITIGSSAGSGTAALLLVAGVTVDSRAFTIPVGTQATVIGAIGSGTVTFGSSGSPLITFGRDFTLRAATGSTLIFNNPWTQSSGTNVNVAVGGSGNAGTVVLGQDLAASGIVRIDSGMLRLATSATTAGSLAAASRIVVGPTDSDSSILDVRDLNAAYTFGVGQTLSGTGTLQLDADTPVSIVGIFSPGNSPGLFTFDGSGTTTLAGTTLMEIEGTSRGVTGGYDAVNLANGASLVLGGALQLWFSGTFVENTTFNLFTLTGTGLSGNFTGVSVSGSSAAYTGLTWSQNGGVWTSSNTEAGQSLRLNSADGTLVVVPEPATLALAAIAIGCVGWMTIRRRR